MKFVIYAPTYDPDNGGAIVLHKLCHLLNCAGKQAYLYPWISGSVSYSHQITIKKFLKSSALPLKNAYRKATKRFCRTNPSFNTPLFAEAKIDDDTVVVYPDSTAGNPLGAKNVVRWFLHQPGYHTGTIHLGLNELFFDYNSFCTGFSIPGSRLSSLRLKITHLPTDLYNLEGSLPMEARSGTAYCIRKGKGRPITHDLTNSTLIDGLGHEEISRIFKRVKRFISYDPYTAYSTFAVLCGAESVVVPSDGILRSQWYPEEWQYYGLAYGDEDLPRATQTVKLLRPHLQKEEDCLKGLAYEFVEECGTFFNQT